MSIRMDTTVMVCLILGFANTCHAQDAVTGKDQKSEAAFKILRQAVIDVIRDRPKVQADNLESLKRLQNVKWPHVSQFPWFHVYLNAAEEGQYTGAWKVEENETDVTLLTAGLTKHTIKKSQVKEMRPASFRDDVDALLQYCRERKEEDKRKWDFTYIQDFGSRGFPYYGGVFLLRYAYAAADCDMNEEATAFVAEVFKRVPEGFSNLFDEMVWQELSPAMFTFQAGGSRRGFLETCKRLRKDYPGSRYDKQLDSLIEPLEKDVSAPKPSFVEKNMNELTSKERIQYWIYQLHDLAGHQWSDPGYPDLFSMDSVSPTAADQIVAIGPPAIPYLIDTLEDDTPTRTIAWQRSFYPIHFILRRQDVAIKCLERIVGCEFYDEAATYMHFYMDTEERKQSVIANIKEWWAGSRDKPQAVMVHNQLKLMNKNITLRDNARTDALEVLAMLEGPEDVVDEGSNLLADDRYGLNSPVREFLNLVNPRAPVLAVFERFWNNDARDGDYTYLFKYGDKRVYEEIVKRFQSSGKLDPGPWTMTQQVTRASEYGKNWAIPIVAGVLNQTKMTGSRYVDKEVGSQPFSKADIAIEEFQKLTGKDFGYDPKGNEEERLAAIERGRTWWESEGKTSMAEKIAEDHPLVVDPGDLFISAEKLDALVKTIQSDKPAERHKAISSLGQVYSFQIQRALLVAMTKETLSDEQLKILHILSQHPKLWHLPTLVKLLREDKDLAVRIQVSSLIENIVGNKTTSIWWKRLETRDAALELARQLAKDKDEPVSIRETAVSILLAWNSFVDQNLLIELATDSELAHYEPLQSHIEKTDMWLKEMPTQVRPQD